MDCLFCKIAKKEIESKKLYEDENFFVFLDMDQSTPGHTLIIPKKHVTDYTELDSKTLFEMFQLASKLDKKLKEKLKKSAMTVLFNHGEAHVQHVHLHLLPDFEAKNEPSTIDEVYEILKDEI